MSRIAALLLCSVLLTACASFVSAVRDTPIEEEPNARTLGTQIDDSQIEFKAKVNLNETDPGLEGSHIVVVSHNGVVLLAGQVRTRQLRSLAGEVVAKLKNVRQVHNELTVGPPTSWPARSNDAWLTAKVKSRLLFTEGIDSAAVNVTTENGVVYLMGLVTRREADLIVASAQKSYGIQKIVRIFEYLD